MRNNIFIRNLALILLSVVLCCILIFLSLSNFITLNNSSNTLKSLIAGSAADAGIQYSRYRLNNNQNFVGMQNNTYKACSELEYSEYCDLDSTLLYIDDANSISFSSHIDTKDGFKRIYSTGRLLYGNASLVSYDNSLNVPDELILPDPVIKYDLENSDVQVEGKSYLKEQRAFTVIAAVDLSKLPKDGSSPVDLIFDKSIHNWEMFKVESIPGHLATDIKGLTSQVVDYKLDDFGSIVSIRISKDFPEILRVNGLPVFAYNGGYNFNFSNKFTLSIDEYFKDALKSILVFDIDLSCSEIEKIEKQLSEKWNTKIVTGGCKSLVPFAY